ncbi:hypothetical protein FB45DRAFT_1050728 [Roridomyces roridus]|uniref:F-box domain-containing protein n=1 Tax=Roridomyces roridus TaxID=1738132 RepID=A0AAD7CK34_9AGAR|nr:hypothetical protein FB45DRAFT_1050728 [Roridomyces roridus]
MLGQSPRMALQRAKGPSFRLGCDGPGCDSLIRAVEPGAAFDEPGGKRLRFHQRIPQSSPLVKLPNELLAEIFSCFEDILQVVYLGTTCQYLWMMARPELYHRIASAAAALSWVGDRVIFIGHVGSGDLAENLLTPDEKEKFCPGLYMCQYPWRRAGSQIFPGTFMGQLDYHVFYSLIDWSYELPYLGPSSILRNLSSRQFVRGAAVEKWKGMTDINETDKITLNEILLSGICWSSDSYTSIAYKGDLHRGVWAGDRFDFVTCEWAEGLKEDEGWTDVSDEALNEIEEIWELEFGRSARAAAA